MFFENEKEELVVKKKCLEKYLENINQLKRENDFEGVIKQTIIALKYVIDLLDYIADLLDLDYTVKSEKTH